MMEGVVPAAQQGRPSLSTAPGEPVDVECPVCYQEYNQHNKCPRMLECLHVFCTECLERIQLCPLGEGGTPALPCPLCRHLTPLEAGNALRLPRNPRVLAGLPPAAFRLPGAAVARGVVLSLEGDGADARFVILPTVSLRVQRMLPGGPCGAAPGPRGEAGVGRRSRKTLLCVQLLAVTFLVLFVIACVAAVLFGPHLFNRKH